MSRVFQNLLLRFAFVLLVNVTLVPVRQATAAEPSHASGKVELPQTSPPEIAFDYAPPLHPYIVVRATVNDGEPMAFVVDSGADTGLALFPWAAKQLKLQQTAFTVLRNNGKIKMTVLEGATLKLRGRKIGQDFSVRCTNTAQMDMPALLADYPDHIAGYIGAEILMAVASRIDFDTKTWTIFGTGPAPRPSEERNTWTVPFLSIDYKVNRGTPQLKVTIGDAAGKTLVERDLAIDTGATSTLLPADVGKELAMIPHGLRNSTMQGVGEQVVVEDVLLPKMTFGPASVSNTFASLSSGIINAALGLNVLAQFRITFSPSEGVLYLEERPGFKPQLYGDTGIVLKRDKEGKFFVQELPVSFNGVESLRKGDRVLSIDGQDITGRSLSDVHSLLNWQEGTAASLSILTKEQPPRTVTVPRRSHFAAPVKEPGLR